MSHHRRFSPLLCLALLTIGARALAFDSPCIQLKDPAGDLSIAKEIIDASTGVVYIAGAGQTISDAAWPDYSPPEGMLKNTTRHLLFDDAC